MTLDTALILVNLILVVFLFAMLIWRRVYRTLPVFVTYVAYTVLLALASLACTASTPDYLLVWSVGTTIDTLFYLCVLVEFGTVILRYNRALPMRWGLVMLLFLGASVPIGLLTLWPNFPRMGIIWQLGLRVMQGTAILEIAALLTMAWWSGFNKLHWPERELRIVMGMGSWALVQLCVLILHEHGLLGPGYHWLDFLTPATTLGVFIYWLHYFWLAGAGDSHHSNRTCVAAQQ